MAWGGPPPPLPQAQVRTTVSSPTIEPHTTFKDEGALQDWQAGTSGGADRLLDGGDHSLGLFHVHHVSGTVDGLDSRLALQ